MHSQNGPITSDQSEVTSNLAPQPRPQKLSIDDVFSKYSVVIYTDKFSPFLFLLAYMELPQRNFIDILSKTFDGVKGLTETSGLEETMDNLTEEDRMQ